MIGIPWRFFKASQTSIRRKMTAVVLFTSTAALVILSIIAFYGMFGARDMAISEGNDIGEQSFQNSAELMEQQRKEELTNIALDKAGDINRRLVELSRTVTTVANQMLEIKRHPQRYLPQRVDEPSNADAGKIAIILQYAPGFDPAAFRDEISMAANIQDTLVRAIEGNPTIESIFIASRNNYTISAEDNRKDKPEGFTPSGLYYDAVASDWYSDAAKAHELVFTNVRRFVFSRKLGVFCSAPYYDEKGELLGVAGAQSSVAHLTSMIKDLQLHSNGFCFVVDNRGHVILCSRENEEGELKIDLTTDLRTSSNAELKDAATNMVAGENGVQEAEIDGQTYFVAYAPIQGAGWSFAAAISADEVIAPIVENNQRIRQVTEENVSSLEIHMGKTMTLMGLCMIVLLICIIYIGKRFSDRLLEPIQLLSDGVREIASGNLEKKLDIRTGDEIEHLAACFNAMTDEIQTYMRNLTKVTAERERIATELSVATDIQASMLPNTFPPFPDRQEFDIFASMRPAKQVGGDFYDFYLLDENHVVITIADVSGKGVPAALFMVIAKTILKNFAMTVTGEDDLSALAICTNDQLCQNNDAMMFVTVFIGMLDIRTGHFVYVNAGHNPPLLYRAEEDAFRYVPVERNHVMGGMDGLEFKSQELVFSPGDMLFLYTDGVTEALNETKDMYGEKRLEDCLNRADAAHSSLKELVATVRNSLDAHVQEAEQSDDITMMVLSYHGTKESR